MTTIVIPSSEITFLRWLSIGDRKKKGQKSSRHLWMSSKELNECPSSCLLSLFNQRTSCISNVNIFLYLLLLFFSSSLSLKYTLCLTRCYVFDTLHILLHLCIRCIISFYAFDSRFQNVINVISRILCRWYS